MGEGKPRIVAEHALIPMQAVGPMKLIGPVIDDELMVPLATYETPLWPSVERGARVTARAGGILATVTGDCMTRSVILEAVDAPTAYRVLDEINQDEVAAEVSKTSRFARLQSLHHEVVGNLIYLRISIHSGDASGHNMVTLAAQQVIDYLLAKFPELSYVSISGNYCTDKKVSAVNAILGRGKRVIVETTISRKLCRLYLKTTPEKVVELNIRKNLIGTMLAGGLRSANAHYANMLLAIYLATGQDAANIVEGSQGITHAEVRDDGLYFSCTMPNIIVGSVGNGKDLDFVRDNLDMLGCCEDRKPGENARRLAAIVGGTVLCGELSLMAAQTNPGELMEAHQRLERKGQNGG